MAGHLLHRPTVRQVVELVPAPEPGKLSLLGIGAFFAFGGYSRRRAAR
ncbi:MAG: PEP-CTERM sorting domain-containing protein [Bryobacteraceae bacterium]